MKSKKASYSQDKVLFDSINSARLELNNAVGLFNELTDAAAIDYASYNLLAARARYSYLLKVAKEHNLSL